MEVAFFALTLNVKLAAFSLRFLAIMKIRCSIVDQLGFTLGRQTRTVNQLFDFGGLRRTSARQRVPVQFL